MPMIYTAFVSKTFSTMMHGGPLGDSSCKKCAIEYKPGKHQLMCLNLHLGLTHTRGGLKGGGVVGRSFWAHCLQYFLAVGRHSLGTTLIAWGACQVNLRFLHTMKNNIEIEIKKCDELNQTIKKNIFYEWKGQLKCNETMGIFCV